MAQQENWQSAARQALMQDPKKTSVMGGLLLVLLVVAGKTLMPANSHPMLAAGNVQLPTNSIVPVSIPGASKSENALRSWLSQPAPTLKRNDFLIRLDDFPIDPAHPGSGVSDGTFWNDVEKSLSVQADQQDQRQSAVAAIQKEAESIRPASTLMGSTMMGTHPRAMVNGMLLGEGDTIDGFCLLKIEPHGIIVQREGVTLEVPMR